MKRIKQRIAGLSPAAKILIFLLLIAAFLILLIIRQQNEIKHIQTEIDQKTEELLNIEEQPNHYSDADREYFSLVEKLASLTESAGNTQEQKIDDFLNTYDERIDYDVSDIDTLAGRLQYLKNRFTDVFTQTAFEKTAEHKWISNGYLYNIHQKKDIFCRYVSENTDGTYSVVLQIDAHSNRWEYQKLHLKKNGGSYIIDDFETLDF